MAYSRRGQPLGGRAMALHPFNVAVVQLVTSHDGPSTAAGNAGRLATPDALRSAFDAFDVDANGTISATEMLAILTRKTTSASQLSLTDAQALIALFDTNADGELDFGEFVAAVAGGDVRV